VIIVDGHKFRQGFIKKNGKISWRCTVKYCAAKICTDDACPLLKSRLPHISSYAVQALTQSEVVIIPRKKLLCWKEEN